MLDFGEGDHCSVVSLYGTTALLGVGGFFIYVQVPVVLKILDINSKKKYGSCIYNPRHPGLKGEGEIT